MIEEVSISQLDPRLSKQVEGAKSALPSNSKYFFEICSNILKQNPGCLELRKSLREEQFKRAIGGKGLSSLLGKVTMPPFMLKGKVSKDPQGALESAESMISKNPANVVAHELLAEAASALSMSRTVVFAFECIKKLHPKDLKKSQKFRKCIFRCRRH